MAMIFKKNVYLLDKVQRNNIFWQYVFVSFICFMKKNYQRLYNTKYMYIFNIPIWHNSVTKIGGKHAFIETLYLNGVKTTGIFLNENGIILSRKYFMERF